MLTDKSLINDIITNKSSLGFERLYDRYASKTYSTCFYYVKNEAEAQDLTQEIFIKLYIQLERFNGDSKFSTWFYSFCRNFCLNYLRSKRVMANLDDSIFFLEDESDTIDLYIDGYSTNRSEMVYEAMKSLSEKDISILNLKYKQNYSVKEIASIVNIGESAVKMRLKRAKSRLASQLPIAV
ncbi:MAG: sigma-70 family RNA polymerase sigma factor [Winogradskyella sp.]|uniref:RNA polymerase sigma factor n=1 Tax=Winogradskyella sp. TaxID=1883156 RepID=UPI000F3C1CB5|nr:sigma-70 family RNA polymerase sigma factor [Winogradskyella sp.]RNC87052.1 MAG: sigma-70 family RNA polymerase sigma factor [Winogradskyella sp.]